MNALLFVLFALTAGLLLVSPIVLLTGLIETWADKPEPPRGPYTRRATQFRI